MEFCTAINCMDGRVQLPVIRYLQKRFSVPHVDSITEPGPNLILAEQKDLTLVHSIIERASISVEKHKSVGIALAGHYDCAGNPAGKIAQIEHIEKGVTYLQSEFDNAEVTGLWVGASWEVQEIQDLE
ncbi:MAG: carbonic anhydrase [Candidatus Brocadiia bacterium]